MDPSHKALRVSRRLAAAVQGKKRPGSNGKDTAEWRALTLPCLEVIPEVYRGCPCVEHLAGQWPRSLKHAAMTDCIYAVSAHFRAQPTLI